MKSKPEELIQIEKLVVEGKFEEAYSQIDKFKENGDYSIEDSLSCNLLKADIMNQQGLYEDVIKLAKQTYKGSIELRDNLLAFDALKIETDALFPLYRIDDVLENIKKGEELLKIILQEIPSEYKKRRAVLEFFKALYHYFKGETDKIDKHIDSCLTLFEEIGENRAYAYALLSSTMIYAVLKGELDLALDNIKKGDAISKKINYKYGIALGLLAKGVIYNLKGDLDQSIINHEQSLSIFKEFNNKFYIAHILNNLADNYRATGDLERALECVESSINLHHEQGNIGGVAGVYDFLIQILIDKGDVERAQKAVEELERMKNQLNDRSINLQYLFNKALVLKTSSRSRNRMEAEDILKQIIEDEFVHYEIHVKAILNLCELLLIELRVSNDLSVLEEIDTYTNQLLGIAEKNHSFILFAEIYYLKAKLALLTLELKTARRFLTQAQRIAERFGYSQLAAKISMEHDSLRNQISMWDGFKKEEISLSERIKFAGMDEQIKHLLKNRDILTTQVKEDQITVHKERKICIVCKGDILGFMYACRCDALYCEKCARALTEIENMCWACNAPIDITKPIKPYKEEEIGKKDIKNKF